MGKDTGGAAFPCEGGSDSGLYADAGMTLRDYFAGQALVALVTSRAVDHLNFNNQSMTAYKYADAMLEARK